MPINCQEVIIWTPVLAVIVALCSLIYQSSRSKFLLSVDLMLKLEDRFNAGDFRSLRRAAALSILNNTNTDADEVLDFFETIGLFVRRRALDKEMVWHTFFYWIHRYSLSANEYISIIRQTDPTIWEDLGSLYEEILSIEKHRRRCSDSDLSLSRESLIQFLKEESEQLK